MQSIAPFLKLLHILAGFILVGGEVGRFFAFRRARQATDVHVTAELLQLYTFLSTKIVAPVGAITVLLGIVTAWVQGWPILGFLQGGSSNWVLASLVLYAILMAVVIPISAPRGKAIGQAVGAAMAQGKITPELTAALNDPALGTAAIVQDVVLVLIIVLMVLKPF